MGAVLTMFVLLITIRWYEIRGATVPGYELPVELFPSVDVRHLRPHPLSVPLQYYYLSRWSR